MNWHAFHTNPTKTKLTKHMENHSKRKKLYSHAKSIRPFSNFLEDRRRGGAFK